MTIFQQVIILEQVRFYLMRKVIFRPLLAKAKGERLKKCN